MFQFHISLVVTTSPPTMVSSIIATKLDNGNIQVTCHDPSLNCLVLIQSTSDVDQLTVGVINDPMERSVTLAPPSSGGDVYVVYTWTVGESILTGQLAFVSQLELPITTSKLMESIL